jgi:nitrate reductase gamma subunit
METLTYLVLVPMVYIAVLVFLLGLAWRIYTILSRPSFAPTLKIFPERHPAWLYALTDAFLLPMVRRHNPVLWFFLMLLHVTIGLLILGHLELFAEMPWLQVWPHEVFLGAGWVGVLSFACLLFLLFRRCVPPAKDLSVPEDYFLLIVLLLAVVFGAEMHLARRLYDFSSMGVEEYREYLMSMVSFAPSVDAVTGSGHSFMLTLHVFFANLFIMVFPFSKMMHAVLSIPANMMRRR